MTKFERRLYVGFAVLVALFTPLLIGAFFVISELESTQGDVLTKNAEDVIKAERLNSLINQEFALVQAFVLRGSTKSIEQLKVVHQSFQSTTADLLANLDVGETPELLEEVLRLEDDTFSYAQTAIGMKERGASIEQINQYFEAKNLTRSARILTIVHENVKIQTDQLSNARAHADHVSRELVWGLIAACAFALLATSAVVILLYQMIQNKVREDRQRDEKMVLQEKLSTARKEAVEIVAHDLKNPLASMKMSVELLKDELADVLVQRSDVATGFHIAERSIVSMQRLIDDQLDHTKIEAGQLAVERSITNLSELIRETDLRFQPLVAAKSIRLTTRADSSLIANVDSARIEQVLSNLLGNAIKFTPEGGSIGLLARRQGDWVSIVVKDNGAGISEESLTHVFERYWQVRETAKKGTGLGLSIAKGIVEAHGGQLTCRSQVGQGSEFEIRLLSAKLNRIAELSH